MSTYTCAVTGEESGAKHYILRTTEGEELVSPDALLNPVKFLEDIARDWGKLRVRVDKLEKLLADQDAEKSPGDEDQEDEEPIAAAAQKAAAPVKKAAAKKSAASQ